MLIKLALSITSFSPIYFLMSIISCYRYVYMENKNLYLISMFLIVITQLLSSILVYLYIKQKENLKISENEIKFNNINENKKAYINYTMMLLLPMVTLNLNQIEFIYINIVIIIFIYINAKAENFYANPILSLKGYAIYTGIRNDGYQKILLIKKKQFSNIRSNHKRYKFVSFAGSNDIYLCKKY